MALRLSRRASQGASNIILGIGVTVIGISASVFAIDMPYYFNVRNQLQTAVDAAALAGAAQLPVSEASAEQAAIAMAAENPVAGQILQAGDLEFTANKARFAVTARTKVPTIVGKFLCALTGGQNGGHSINDDGTSTTDSGSGGGFTEDNASCNEMSVVAGSAAEPAARDTILVIDTSSSMDDLGNGRPMKDIKTAANNFIDTIAGLDNNYVDQIGLVSFNQTGTLQIGLTSQKTSPSFQAVKDKITTKLNLYSGIGWNTNYEAGLKTAVDELANHGRKNAQKIIIFMTDGMPNLPAPDSYYSYSQYEPYRKCTDAVNNSSAVKAKCTKNGRQTVCPVLPSSTITDSMISSTAVQCGQTYVDAMSSKTNTQTDRANSLGINIYTISIYYPGADDNAQEVLRRLIKQPDWRPGQLDYMAETTGGTGYEAAAYDASRINDIYKTIAQDIHIKLVN